MDQHVKQPTRTTRYDTSSPVEVISTDLSVDSKDFEDSTPPWQKQPHTVDSHVTGLKEGNYGENVFGFLQG